VRRRGRGGRGFVWCVVVVWTFIGLAGWYDCLTLRWLELGGLVGFMGSVGVDCVLVVCSFRRFVWCCGVGGCWMVYEFVRISDICWGAGRGGWILVCSVFKSVGCGVLGFFFFLLLLLGCRGTGGCLGGLLYS